MAASPLNRYRHHRRQIQAIERHVLVLTSRTNVLVRSCRRSAVACVASHRVPPGQTPAARLAGSAEEVTVRGRHAQAIHLFQRMGDVRGVADTVALRGDAALAAGDRAAARNHWEHSLSLFADLREEVGMAPVLRKLGDLALDDGDLAGAEDHLQRALPMAERVADPWATAEACLGLARLRLTSGAIDHGY
jgi:tetratricopeptide (TPR) repeat protein